MTEKLTHQAAAARLNNRRGTSRFKMQLNVQFHGEDHTGHAAHNGTTYDVSAGGAYFHTHHWQHLQRGQQITLRMCGASSHGHGPLLRSFNAQARVIRVEPLSRKAEADGRGGVAVEFNDSPCYQIYRWSA